jgi:chromosome segregation ATPase
MLAAGLLALALSIGAGVVSLHDRLQLAEEAVRARDAILADLRAKLEVQRGVVGAVWTDADTARAALRTTQRLLTETTQDLRTGEQMIAAQREDIQALQTCLVGARSALQYMAGGNAYGALHYLVAVDSECRAAQILLTVQAQR